jgi:hypothetical protein
MRSKPRLELGRLDLSLPITPETVRGLPNVQLMTCIRSELLAHIARGDAAEYIPGMLAEVERWLDLHHDDAPSADTIKERTAP